MYKIKFIKFLFILVTFTFYSCVNSNKKEIIENTSLESLANFVSNSKTICDTITKLKMNNNSKLLICSQEIGKSGKILKLTESCIPFQIKHDYYYKKINGLDVIFYDYNKPLTNKKNLKEIELLTKNKIVKFESNNNWTCCEMPYYIFSMCNKNKELNCYNFETITNLEREYFNTRKVGGSTSTYNLLCAH